MAAGMELYISVTAPVAPYTAMPGLLRNTSNYILGEDWVRS